MVSREQWRFWNRRVIQSVLCLGRFFWDACLVAQSCLTPYCPMDCSLPGSSIHRIFQAKTLEWVAISYSRGSSQPRDQTRVSCVSCVSCTNRQILYWCTTWEAYLSGDGVENGEEEELVQGWRPVWCMLWLSICETLKASKRTRVVEKKVSTKDVRECSPKLKELWDIMTFNLLSLPEICFPCKLFWKLKYKNTWIVIVQWVFTKYKVWAKSRYTT